MKEIERVSVQPVRRDQGKRERLSHKTYGSDGKGDKHILRKWLLEEAAESISLQRWEREQVRSVLTLNAIYRSSKDLSDQTDTCHLF